MSLVETWKVRDTLSSHEVKCSESCQPVSGHASASHVMLDYQDEELQGSAYLLLLRGCGLHNFDSWWWNAGGCRGQGSVC